MLFEPWPISLRQGPDTEFARACYERHLGEEPPPDVQDLYCRDEWGFGGDSIYTIRFSFRDRGAMEDIVQRLQLVEVASEQRSGLRYLRGPSWWQEESSLSALPMAYQRASVDFLWVDEEAREAFFQRASF